MQVVEDDQRPERELGVAAPADGDGEDRVGAGGPQRADVRLVGDRGAEQRVALAVAGDVQDLGARQRAGGHGRGAERRGHGLGRGAPELGERIGPRSGDDPDAHRAGILGGGVRERRARAGVAARSGRRRGGGCGRRGGGRGVRGGGRGTGRRVVRVVVALLLGRAVGAGAGLVLGAARGRRARARAARPAPGRRAGAGRGVGRGGSAGAGSAGTGVGRLGTDGPVVDAARASAGGSGRRPGRSRWGRSAPAWGRRCRRGGWRGRPGRCPRRPPRRS